MIPASIDADHHRSMPSLLNSSAFAPLLSTTGPGRRPGPAAWCPTMDLLALSSADGRLAVRRLDWTRLWSARVGANASSSSSAAAAATAAAKPAAVAPAASVTALAWRPDGRALAVASSCGGLEVRAAEDGEVLASLSGGAGEGGGCSFVALSWATDGGGDGPAAAPLSLRDSLVASGPPLPPCPLPAPEEFEERREAEAQADGLEAEVAEAAEEEEEGAAPPTTAKATRRTAAPPPRREPSSLQVLAAADSAGVVHLFGPGLVPLARLPVAEAAKRGSRRGGEAKNGEASEVDVEIRAVALSTGLDSLHVLLAAVPGGPPSSGTSNNHHDHDKEESLFLATVDTRALARARRELARVLHCAGHALSLLSVAARSAGAAAAHWSEAEGTVRREVLSKLEKLQADFGEGEEEGGGAAAARTMEEEGGIGLGGRIGGSSGGGGGRNATNNKENSPDFFSSSVACLSKAALCGAVSAPLAHFWESDPGPRGLRAAARAADSACLAASGIVLRTTEPALEAACYYVGELQRVAESSSSSALT